MNGRVNNLLHKIRRSASLEHEENWATTSKSDADKALDLGNGLDAGVLGSKSCQLAHNVDRLLSDSSALSYFINFMDSCDKLNLVKFWMHVDGFRASIANIPQNSRATAEKMCQLDAVHIYKKYIDQDSPSTIAIPKKLYNKILAKINADIFDAQIFDEAHLFVKELFELRFFPEFLGSIYYKKHEFDVLLREECDLMDILRIESLLAGFLELSAESGDGHWVEMVLSVDTWEKQWANTADEETLEDAMAIYNKFFSMQAARARIPLSDESRKALESRICTENGRPHRDAFSRQKLSALEYLTQKLLHQFRQSAVFQSYLNELSSTIINSIELPRIGGRRNEKRASSVTSSGRSDSLPSLITQHQRNTEKMVSCDERKQSECSSASLTDAPHSSTEPPPTPSATPTKKSARLAEIDSMGRYTPLYDTTFTTERENAQSKLKMTLRRYLDKSGLREEELAEEVARTIIADIQTMVHSAGST
ncbi:unnamed protein product, partial [Mesorhabditis belari]|uniref:RGS domain-containing protein n=1 Tax=Mesorhabditis belari TaxID=2138241 RepID=A0AAF3EAU3_9BILA